LIVQWTGIARLSSAVACFYLLLFFADPVYAQGSLPEAPQRNWDIGVWVAGATGEESLNSFSEAQILTTGLFIGRVLTGEIGSGWRRGRFEYGFNFVPVFRQLRPQSIYGGGFEPVILRWNSSLHAGLARPYIELAGGAVRTDSNLPAGDTSSFNFTARGGGGIQIFAKRQQSIEIGCNWWHISNANLGVRNPEFNGIQMSVGYHWFK
jgi:hypothetical protein